MPMWTTSEREAPGASEEWEVSLIGVDGSCFTDTWNAGVDVVPRFATVYRIYHCDVPSNSTDAAVNNRFGFDADGGGSPSGSEGPAAFAADAIPRKHVPALRRVRSEAGGTARHCRSCS